MSAYVQICKGCFASYFPKRLICPACSSTDFSADAVDSGTVETTTMLANGVQMATVVTGKPSIYFIARIIGGHTESGASVPLTNEETIVSEATAFVPLGHQHRGES